VEEFLYDTFEKVESFKQNDEIKTENMIAAKHKL